MFIEKNIKDLRDLTKKFRTDKVIHGFIPLYAKHIGDREKYVKVLEIGIKTGNSLRLWKHFFPHAKIYGIDISEEYALAASEDRIHTVLADQKNRDDLREFVNREGGGFNLIIDDGSHRMLDQQVSLGFLFPYLANRGWYVIEDLNTSLNPKFGLPAGHRHTTLKVLEKFNIGRDLYTPYITSSEKVSLEADTKFCKIYYLKENKNIIAFIKKRVRKIKQPKELRNV